MFMDAFLLWCTLGEKYYQIIFSTSLWIFLKIIRSELEKNIV